VTTPASPARTWDLIDRPDVASRPVGTLVVNRLLVDRIACDGYGMCAELLPELVELDDWGYPIVDDGGVPDALLEHARRAVAVCPVLALRLERDVRT
jgi:ferredoxin